MSDLPNGTVTFLFSDVEGSTWLWEQHPDGMKAALACHDLLLRRAVESNQGTVIKTTGDGMLAAFQTVIPAMQAALAVQQALSGEAWVEIEPQTIRVRMALHTGAAELRAGDYFGPALNRAARLMAAGHGGQVLLSDVTAGLARDDLPADVSLLDLGEQRLKDLSRPERVYQLVHPGLARDFPPLKTLESFPNNLPQQLTSFVGRQSELAMTRSRLENARLLTLIGPGGTGKTRLALQLAADVLPRYLDGVWLVELAPLADPALVLQTVASVLKVREVPGLTLQELLTNTLRGRHLLLVLDNCEHLIEACASLADHMLRVCPHLQMIASSREALGIGGEVIYRVPPLALPADVDTSPDNLCEFESVQLFVERAQAVQPQFSFTAANAPAVAQISRRLDGIPLALELAAARVRMMPPEQIAAHLDDRFRLLTGGSRTALPRQQTLRSLIDWSYDLLSEPERTLFRSLAVFVGGWSIEAAEALTPDLDVWSLLEALVNKSLVAQEDAGGVARYRLLETIRQYARDRLLESPENAHSRDRHFKYYYEWIDPSLPHRLGSHSKQWYDMCEREKDNLRAAFSWGLEVDPDAVLRLAAALADFWTRRGYYADVRAELSSALQRVDSLPALTGEAQQLRLLTRARALLAISQPIFHDYSTRISAGSECVRLFRQYGSREELGFALGILATNESMHGDLDQAEQHLVEAIALGRETGDTGVMAMTLGLFGQVILAKYGDLEGARRASDESARIGRQSGDSMPWGSATAILNLGVFNLITGQYDQARRYSQEAHELFQELGDPLMTVNAQSNLGHIELANGNFSAAAQIYRQTLPRYLESQHFGAIAHQLEMFATISRREDHLARAARLFGAAEALRESVNIPMAPYEREGYEREVTALRQAMTPEALALGWEEGRRLTTKQAVEFALEKET